MNQRSRRRSSLAVTINDVAARAGVSAMTVSNVLSGRKKVQESTVEAVRVAIKELGYTPNAAARALASASQLRIGLLYRNPQSAFLSSVLVGALNASAQQGAQLLIRNCEADDAETTFNCLNALVRSGAEALLLPPPFCELADRTPELRSFGVPLMALSSGRELLHVPGVRIDDFGAARAMTAHLVALGHRRIALIQGPTLHYASATRLAGYQAALEDAGIEADPSLVAAGDFTFESGLLAARSLLDLPHPPTAIFASNDDMAAAVVSEAHRRALTVPGDLSIAGFDDTPISVKIWPPLTTVRQPIVEMSELATCRLIETLRQPQADTPEISTTTHVAFAVIERESTAPAASRTGTRSGS